MPKAFADVEVFRRETEESRWQRPRSKNIVSNIDKTEKCENFEDSANWVNFEAMTSVLSGCAVISKIVTNSIIGGLLCNFLSFLFFFVYVNLFFLYFLISKCSSLNFVVDTFHGIFVAFLRDTTLSVGVETVNSNILRGIRM